MQKQRNTYLLRKYGITEAEYEDLFRKQRGRCGVCDKPESHFTRRLAVDHNHRTGEIRGLLCFFCNRRVIGRHTDPELLLRASVYLRGGTGRFVPKRKRRKRRK